MKDYFEIRKDIINFVRKNTRNVSVPVYSAWGSHTKNQKLPLWYSDTCKLCYPEYYYKKEQVQEAMDKIKNYLKENNLEERVSIDFEENYYIGGLHCNGYKIKLYID